MVRCNKYNKNYKLHKSPENYVYMMYGKGKGKNTHICISCKND